jgi:hypothetical protein
MIVDGTAARPHVVVAGNVALLTLRAPHYEANVLITANPGVR